MQISAVIPVFNEENNIGPLTKDLVSVLQKISSSYEIIFANDGSTDSTLEKIKAERNKNKKIKFINFSRNFGHMAALEAGLTVASGKKVVTLDADLQDPPKIILKMYAKSLKGYQVVYGIKKERQETGIKKIGFASFYKVLNLLSNYKMPENVGTFALMDKMIADLIVSLPEKNKYISGLRSWSGFKQTGVYYERPARFSGKPASFKRLFKLAFDGIFSFSYLPLRLASFLGICFSLLAFIASIIILILRFAFNFGLIGWASTLTTILLVSGVQLLTLGIIGEYLGRIYDEVKARPKYIIAQKVGLK